jgi:hypothetical protein
MKKYINLIPLAILVCAQFYSIYIVNSSNIILGSKQYEGAAFVIASLILLLLHKRKWSIYLTGIALFLGASNFIAFLPVIESYSFGFSFNNKGGFELRIQLFSLLVLFIYLIGNGRVLIRLLRKPHSKTKKRKSEINNNAIGYLPQAFDNYD